jgi:hypothetical protein
MDKQTGKIYWHSELADDLDELPEDIDDEKYVEIPHKKELDLGKKLVLDFAFQYLPDEYEAVESMFRRKGVYSKFKDLLLRKGVVDKCYEYQSHEEEKALRAWCNDNDITIQD